MVKKIHDDGQESRERILAAARTEFAEKGFDGARVDEIARRANVNKALIYYYFQGKEELLQELLRQFLVERKRRRTSISHDPAKKDLPGRVAEFDVDFLFQQRDILRVAMMEDLKASKIGLPNSGTVLTHWLDGLAESRDTYAEQGYGFRYTPRVMAAMYFYHLIPILSFATLGETLANVLGIDHAELREEFLKLVQETTATQFHSVFGDSSRDPAPEVRIPGLVPRPPSESMIRIFALFRDGTTYTKPQVESLLEEATGKSAEYLAKLVAFGNLVPSGEGFAWKSNPSAPAPTSPRPQDHISFDPSEREAILAKLLRNGKVAKFPLKEKARVALLEHLSGLFQSGRSFTEREVNETLSQVVDDFAKARRYLVDLGYLDRKPDGSAYWSRG